MFGKKEKGSRAPTLGFFGPRNVLDTLLLFAIRSDGRSHLFDILRWGLSLGDISVFCLGGCIIAGEGVVPVWPEGKKKTDEAINNSLEVLHGIDAYILAK